MTLLSLVEPKAPFIIGGETSIMILVFLVVTEAPFYEVMISSTRNCFKPVCRTLEPIGGYLLFRFAGHLGLDYGADSWTIYIKRSQRMKHRSATDVNVGDFNSNNFGGTCKVTYIKADDHHTGTQLDVASDRGAVASAINIAVDVGLNLVRELEKLRDSQCDSCKQKNAEKTDEPKAEAKPVVTPATGARAAHQSSLLGLYQPKK